MFRILLLISLTFFVDLACGQDVLRLTSLPLTGMQAFSDPSSNWKIVGDVTGSYTDAMPKVSKGSGILFNDFRKDIQFNNKANLVTTFEHGDIFLSLDFLIPKGSNSGLYFQGRYEIQLFDSWLVNKLSAADCGGIYERWDETRAEGKKGYEGHPPRSNASFAPNEWQHLEIEFEAPRFDSSGKRIRAARFVKVVLNGVMIHENVLVFGPTRASAFADEKPKGPIVIQGDHGPVAFRNIQYALLNDFEASLTDLTYEYYEGRFNAFNELTKEKLTRQGVTEGIDMKLADDSNNMGLVFTGKLKVEEEDDYQFIVARNGLISLAIDGKVIMERRQNFVASHLTAGEHTLQLKYIKNYSWSPTKLGLFINKPNSRPIALHLPSSMPNEPIPPLIDVQPGDDPEIIRSFMEFKGKKKTHVLSVGDPSGVNYSYDLDQAAPMRIWRGDFLNVSEMWYERGEPQTAAPMGAFLELSSQPLVTRGRNDDVPLPDSLTFEEFKYKGYSLNEKRTPVFKYEYQGNSIEDRLEPLPRAQGIRRSITVNNLNAAQGMMVRAAKGVNIQKVGEQLYVIDNQRYYIQLPSKVKAQIIDAGAMKELIVPFATSSTVEFSLIW